MNIVQKYSAVALMAFASSPVLAHWALQQEQSSLHFVTVKNDTIAETNSFNRFAANINDDGQINVQVDLSSVDTLIDLRNQRLRDILFNTKKYPKATLAAQLDKDYIDDLAQSTPENLDLSIQLTLHGESQTLPAKLTVTKLDAHTLLVATRSPILLNAQQFSLTAGLTKLQELAGLNSISPIVPITGNWTFKLEH
ncbi:YceI family protein [Gilvimarinus agarilyticus]|uniref:YceI family protein n=1 Tax=unclassified Gilvimarinus TaxID=2642066 RepID=UPI001C086943|nr:MULTISPECIES: YceI family protein [unclassified Gilvimarinus]MBU2887094.1 YceI family protein [Gilvimarinus agarilyticus]MDO6571753.1 YceI family protein [Gilvimarinus sp. 2_MG-2023]MDO6745825.1 YceI family protein [Gilvimarinus sp. 1_MG-2023]